MAARLTALLLAVLVLAVACSEPTPTPTAIPSPTPELTPTPTATPTPKDCPDVYKRDRPGYPSMSNEEARSYRPSLHEPGLTLMQALCDDLLPKLVSRASVAERSAVERLGRELAQEHIDARALSSAALRWYRSLPNTSWTGQEFEVELTYTDSFRVGGEPRYSLLFNIPGKEFPVSLGEALNRRYGGGGSSPKMTTGAGEIITCSERDRDWIMWHADWRAARLVLTGERRYEDEVYCKTGIF